MSTIELQSALVDTWRTNNRVTVYLFENLPEELWPERVPGAPRRTVRMIAGHIHNCRCMWIKMLGRRRGIAVPPAVNRHRVTRRQLLPALERSSQGIVQLLELGIERQLTGGHAGTQSDHQHPSRYHAEQSRQVRG